MADNRARSSRMEAELHKRKLEQIQGEREKLQDKMIKDSEAAFKGALLSNIKALEKMNKNLGAIGGAVSKSKTASAKSLTVNHAKVMAKNTQMMVKHAVSQVNLLKSIDKSLINVASMLKPQYRVFEKSIDALAVRMMDKTPVRVHNVLADPKKSGIHKALDLVFGSKAPAMEVRVQNWQEIREGQRKTRTDLAGRLGQIVSTGILGSITGLGGTQFARAAQYESTSQQQRRMLREVQGGSDPSKILAREKSTTKMSEIERLFSGAGGVPAEITFAALNALRSAEGRDQISKVFSEVLGKGMSESRQDIDTFMSSDILNRYGSGRSILSPYQDSLTNAAQKSTGFNGTGMFTDFEAKTKTQTSTATETVKGFATAFAEATVEKTKKLKQSGTAFVDATSESIRSGIDTIKEIFGKMFDTTKMKLMSKALFTVIKTGIAIGKIKKNTDDILDLMKKGFSGSGDGSGDKPRGIFGKLKDKWKNRESFKLTDKMGSFQKLMGLGMKGAVTYAKVKTMPAIAAAKIAKTLFGGSSFRMSGISDGKTAKVLKGGYAATKGAIKGGWASTKAVAKGGGLFAKAFGKIFGGDTFRLRRSKEKKEERQGRRQGLLGRLFGGGKDKLLFKIYKLLVRRLPSKSAWKKIGRGGNGAGMMSGAMGMMKNPMALATVGVAASAFAGYKGIMNTIDERKQMAKQREQLEKTKKSAEITLARSDIRTKKKYGISTSDFIAKDKAREASGKSKIASIAVLKELRKMGYTMEDDIPQEAINKARSIVTGKAQKSKALVKKISPQVSDVITSKDDSTGQTVVAVPSEQRIVSNTTKTSADDRMDKMMKFLVGEFTNNLVMNLSKSGSINGGQKSNKGTAPGLNVFK